MKKNLLNLILLACTSFTAQAQIFSQDFGDASANAVDASAFATSSNPTKKMFTFISNYGNSKSSIVDGKLQFNKTANSTTHFVRNLDFAPNPKLIKVSFKFQCVDAVGDFSLNQATFMLGANFINDATLPSQADTHSKFGISMSGTDFKLNVVSNQPNTTTSQSSATFSGQQTLTFIANNSGAVQKYLAPDGSTETVADDTWDLWVGNTKVYNDIAAYGNSDIKHFRFSMLSAAATIATVKVLFDDIEIQNLYDMLAWDFSGQTGTLTGAANPIINQAGLENSTLIRGGGLVEGGFNNSYFSTVSPASPTKTDAITNGTFYSFTVKPKANYAASLTTLNSKVRRNTTGPKKIQWQYSTNGVTFIDLGTEVDLGTTSDGEVQAPINLTGIAALQNVSPSTTVTFRLLGWDAADGGGFAVGRITSNASGNSLFLEGTVQETALPVTLTSFKANKQNNAVRLNWTTASEENNSYFEILRAGDDQKFVGIGKIKGNGTVVESKSYSFIDQNPLAGTNYYQLSQTDADGKTKQIGTVQYVKFDFSNTSLTVLQTTNQQEVKALLNIDKAAKANVFVYNISGNSLYQGQFNLNSGVNEIVASVSLNRGMYILKVKTQSGEIWQTKFVK